MSRSCQFGLTVAAMLIVISGCGVQGTWVSRDVQPPEAKKHYNLVSATFNADRTFQSAAEEGGKMTQSKGTYTYDPWTKKLMLKTGGKELTYTAVLWWGTELHVTKKMDDERTATVIMAQGTRCPHCGKCAAGSAK